MVSAAAEGDVEDVAQNVVAVAAAAVAAVAAGGRWMLLDSSDWDVSAAVASVVDAVAPPPQLLLLLLQPHVAGVALHVVHASTMVFHSGCAGPLLHVLFQMLVLACEGS